MAQNRGSLSEQAQRRGNRVLLIIGGLLLLLFLSYANKLYESKYTSLWQKERPHLG